MGEKSHITELTSSLTEQTSIFPTVDARLGAGLLPQQSSDAFAPKGNCPGANGGAGIKLTFAYADGQISLLHLQDFSPNLLTADGRLNLDYVSDEDVPVATSGNTGTSNPHLHYEVYKTSLPSCVRGKRCKLIRAPIDPFPLFVNEFVFAQTVSTRKNYPGASFDFVATAHDYLGINVSSAVRNPGEDPGEIGSGGSYDPTRKICALSSDEGAISFPRADNDLLSFDGPPLDSSGRRSYCVPWGPLTAHGNASAPATILAKFSTFPTTADEIDLPGTISSSVTVDAGNYAAIGGAVCRKVKQVSTPPPMWRHWRITRGRGTTSKLQDMALPPL